jgi:hypothetical protein
MKIPRKIKILAHPVKVRCYDEILEHPDGDPCWGLAHKMSDKISICIAFSEQNGARVELSEASIADTFLHEIIHHIDSKLDLDLKENQVAGLACGLLQVIRDNKLDFRGAK